MYIQNHRARNIVSKFRLSSHNLHIETGRHQKPKIPKQLRTCKCDNTSIEDEIHVLLQCPFYSDKRTEFFNCIIESGKIDMNLLNNVSDHSRFITIMSNRDSEILYMLSKFLLNCFKIRQDHPK